MPEGALSPVATLPAFASRLEPTFVDLRPLTTSELIDRGFSLYRAHFTGFLLIALLAQSAPLLGQILVTSTRLNPSPVEFFDRPGIFLGKMGLILVITILAQIIVFGFEVLVTFYISDAWLGKIPTVSGSFRRLLSCLVPAIWTCLLGRLLIGSTFLFSFAVLSGVYVYALIYPPATFGPLVGLGVVALVGFILAMVPVLVVFMRLMVTVPVQALERLSGWSAVVRSSLLVRHDPGLGILYWGEMRISFLLLPLFVIELLILSLTSLPLVIFQVGESIRHGSTGQLVTPPESTLVLSQILTFLAGSLIWPLYSIATTLFYYDVRMRREGFDLEFMAGRLTGSLE